jgi:hypothetical protein
VPTTVLRSVFVLAASVILVTSAAAQSVDLRWIPPTSSGVSGYNVYVAPSGSGPLVATPIDVGRPAVDATGVSTARITGIDRSRLLGIEMTSYDSLRRESARSNRVLLAPLGETLAAPIYTANFAGWSVGAHPIGFFDWGGRFQLGAVDGGRLAVVAPTTSGNTVSRYLATSSSGWGPYEISGRIYLPTGARVAGVAVRVGASDLSSGFLFGGDTRRVFALEQRGKSPLRCASSASTGVSVLLNRWFQFRLRYTNPSSRARLRAKVWREGEAEPIAWQADCWTDIPAASDSGVFAVYRDVAGLVNWDNLVVRPVTGTLDPIP